MTKIEQLEYLKNAIKNKTKFRFGDGNAHYIIDSFSNNSVYIEYAGKQYEYSFDNFFSQFKEVEEKKLSKTEELYRQFITDFNNGAVYVCKTEPKVECCITSISYEVCEKIIPKMNVRYVYGSGGKVLCSSIEKFLNEFEKEDNSMYILVYRGCKPEFEVVVSKDALEEKINVMNRNGFKPVVSSVPGNAEFCVSKFKPLEVVPSKLVIKEE